MYILPMLGLQQWRRLPTAGRYWAGCLGVRLSGFVYFAIVFAAGFALGTIRTLWLVPAVGQLSAVAIELPFMLGVSWIACGWCLRRFSISARHERVRMGASAFLCLMAAEVFLTTSVFGVSLEDYAAELLTAAGLLGLAGQVAFAVLPLVPPDPKTGTRQHK